MRLLKPNPWLAFVILVIVTLGAIWGYRSIHKTCCTEDLSDDQLSIILNAAEHGDVAAMKRLYFFFEEAEDPMRATLWLKRAADAGDARAEEFMYENLRNSHNDKEKVLAVGYLRRAAEHGSTMAQEELGKLYRDGFGVHQNLKLAEYWLRKSARSGDQEGILALCDLAVLQEDKSLCEECLELDTLGLKSLNRESYLAKELVSQHERIALKLKDLNVGKSRVEHPK